MSKEPRKPEVTQEVYSIVVLGSFSPTTFQPYWFSSNGLIPEEEAKTATVSIIHNNITSLTLGSIQIQAEEERLEFRTTISSAGPILRDLAFGTLTILEHVPLTAIGLNSNTEFQTETIESWHEIGDRLVPKQDWNRVMDEPGMLQVAVVGKRSSCNAKRVEMRVLPKSEKIVIVSINQHYQLASAENEINVQLMHVAALKILSDDWVSFVNYARTSALTLVCPSYSSGSMES